MDEMERPNGNKEGDEDGEYAHDQTLHFTRVPRNECVC